MASDADDIFNNGRELSAWCKQNSRFFLAKNGLHVFNWTSSNLVSGNILIVNGSWREKEKDRKISCSVLKRAQRKFAVLIISGERREVYTKRGSKVINSRNELEIWCKNESTKIHLEKGISPYNWTSAHWTKYDFLFVQGSWRVGNDKAKVQCSIRRGRIESDAILEKNEL